MLFEGAISVKAVLSNEKRSCACLYVAEDKKDKNTAYILRLAKNKKVKIVRCKREVIDSMASGRTHGGIVLEASERTYQRKEDLVNTQGFIALIEGVEDPFNLGYIFRTLYSAGCQGVILKTRDWSNGEVQLNKASAGAFEYMPILLSEDLVKDLKYFKDLNYELLCAYRDRAIPYYQQDYTRPFILAIGGEMRGLSKEVLGLCDQAVYIPYANDFRNALNAAAATAVIAYEALRQRSLGD